MFWLPLEMDADASRLSSSPLRSWNVRPPDTEPEMSGMAIDLLMSNVVPNGSFFTM